jgi:uncharacterized membrane protein
MELTEANTRERLGNVPQRRQARTASLARVPERQARPDSLDQRAVGLGWFSVGLGLAQLIAPRQVARLIGADHRSDATCNTIMAVGVRELTCGVGLLSRTQPAAWAWARVAGDVMDMGLLAYAWRDGKASREQVLGAGGTVLAAALLDAETAIALGRAQREPLAQGITVKQSITVQRTPDEAYAFFRDLQNLPSFMAHLESVVEESQGRSRWRAKGPLGVNVEWQAEVIEERPGELIAWRSLPGADVPNRGVVTFKSAPGQLGTEITVDLSYDPPIGAVGATIAKLFGREPSQEVSADLRRLKQVLETGEVLHSDSSIHAGMHPARPSRLSSSQQKQVKP